jgi:hypothetical protein
MHLIFLLLSLGVFAATDSKNAFDKSYPRDNTFCSINGKRIEFLIRGGSKFTEPRERGYGELIFYRLPSKKPRLLRSHPSGDTYRLFSGKNSLCSKSFAYELDKSTYAVLLLKENHPYKDKLVIQLIDTATLLPKDFIETDYPTDKAKAYKNGFSFRKLSETNNQDFGKVNIAGENFIFQERVFPLWISYSKAGFKVTEDLTFEEFPWKVHFKDQKDFLEATKWNESDKAFENKILYLAVNHKLKKECLLISNAKQKLVGNEAWRCYTKKAE